VKGRKKSIRYPFASPSHTFVEGSGTLPSYVCMTNSSVRLRVSFQGPIYMHTREEGRQRGGEWAPWARMARARVEGENARHLMAKPRRREI